MSRLMRSRLRSKSSFLRSHGYALLVIDQGHIPSARVWTHLCQVRYVCDLTMQNGLHSFSLVADTQQRQLGTPIRSCHIVMFKQIVVSCRVLSSPGILA